MGSAQRLWVERLRSSVSYTAINKLSNANFKTRTLALGVGVAFKF